MDFEPSAGKHGISQEDVLHAIRNVRAYRLQLDRGEDRMLIIGPDTNGRLLEIVVVPSVDPTRVIHADVLRPKFYDLLKGGQS